MEGVLFCYGKKSSQIAFQSGKTACHAILIGGLGDGLMSIPYKDALFVGLESLGWSLVQMQLSSSYQGFGTCSLDQDAEEMSECIKYLKAERGCSQIMLIGHSSGCQDITRFMQKYGQEEPFLSMLKCIVLQAGVSDQELGDEYPEMVEYRQKAKVMMDEGKETEIVMRNFITSNDGTPMTATRFLALYQHYGDDDMFSSYLTDEELKARLSCMGKLPCLVLQSGKDEYIPKHVDQNALFKRVTAAIGDKAKYQVVEGAIHNLEGSEQQGADAICNFLAQI